MKLVDFSAFVGADYKSQSVNVATSELVNWYVEPTESATDREPFPAALYPTPGLSSFVTSLNGPIRGLHSQDGLVLAVGGTKVYDVQGDGTADLVGTLISDDQPVSMVSNGHGGHQVLIVSAGNGYIFDLVSRSLVQITAAGFPQNAVMADFIDGYFVVLQATTSKFYLSAPFNGLSWSPSDVGQVSSSSDALMAFRVLQRNLWNLGSLRSEVWVTQAGGSFPLAPIQPLIEGGIAAIWSVAEIGGVMFFVAVSEQGSAMVVMTNGYGFARVSTFNEERILNALPDLANVRAYSYQELGHAFYVLCPNTGPALVYDMTTALWHRRGVWNEGADRYDPPLQWCHAYGHGRHLVGDRTSGTIYTQTTAVGSDAGMSIRRLRTCPHVDADQEWMFGSQVTIGVETGLSPGFTNPQGVFFTPEILLSYSKDGGHTFSTPRSGSLGALGDYGRLVTWHRTPGRFSDLVLRAVSTATTPVRINSCQLRLEAGTGQR